MNQRPQARERARRPGLGAAVKHTFPELLFAILPLLVLGIVLRYSGKNISDVFRSPEWAFASAILFGQTVVRLIGGAIRSRGTDVAATIVVVTAVLVLGWVPSLVVLALMLHSIESGAGASPFWLILTQLGLFAVSTGTFLFLGGMGSLLSADGGE